MVAGADTIGHARWEKSREPLDFARMVKLYLQPAMPNGMPVYVQCGIAGSTYVIASLPMPPVLSTPTALGRILG